MATKNTQATQTTTNDTSAQVSADTTQSTQQQSPSPAPITSVANAQNHGTKLDNLALYSALVAGMLANFSPDDVFYLMGKSYKRDEAVGEFNGFINTATATNQAKIDWRNDVVNERTVLTHVRPMRAGMKGIVSARYGKNSPQMIAFGFAPTAPRKQTVDTKQQAAAKRKATKEARMTNLGKKQKKKIKAPPQAAPQAAVQQAPQPVPVQVVVQTAPPAPVVSPAPVAPTAAPPQSNSNQGNGPTGH